MSESEDDAL
jgi:hypothetical protein